MTEKEKMSYALGMNVIANISELPFPVDLYKMLAGISDRIYGKEPKIPIGEYHKQMEKFQEKVSSVGQEKLNKIAKANRKAGDEYLKANALKAGVVTTESGLQYRVITEGSGKRPEKKDRVRVHYTGKLIDGTVFDSSVQRGEPAEFGVTQVIRGWVEALQMMTTGSKYELTIPSDLAYGDRGAGSSIPPAATLIFEVELLEIL